MVKAGESQSSSTDDVPGLSGKQKTLKESFASVTPYEKSSRRHREVTNAITYYLAKDMVSIYGGQRGVQKTTDNGTNVIKAMELNQWTRLRCFGHRLHLVIGKCRYPRPPSISSIKRFVCIPSNN